MEFGVMVILYGVWGTVLDWLWIVGFVLDNSELGVILIFDGKIWELVVGLLELSLLNRNFFKVWGIGDNDIWVVGWDDLILYWDG